MSFRSSGVLVGAFLGLWLAACASGPGPACCPASCASPAVQKVVDGVARQHPEVVRLTVHGRPEGCDKYCAIASTLAEKVCKVSDPEDLEAMNTGRPIVLAEVGAVDVTVPVCKVGANWTKAVGVTFKEQGGMAKEQYVGLAQAIAKVVEDGMMAGR